MTGKQKKRLILSSEDVGISLFFSLLLSCYCRRKRVMLLLFCLLSLLPHALTLMEEWEGNEGEQHEDAKNKRSLSKA
ncbi:Uncharacterised protein [Mycobacterium tuberculosis]|nr:Uncharacterised protein [Mycobacterium tuberculosis]